MTINHKKHKHKDHSEDKCDLDGCKNNYVVYKQATGQTCDNNLNMKFNRIINLRDGICPYDAVNLSQVQTMISTGISNSLANVPTDINMNSHKITNLASGTNPGDAVNYFQLQQAISETQNLSGVLSNGNSAGTNNIDMNSNKVINLASGTNPTDAVNYAQLQAVTENQNLTNVLTNGNSAGTNNIDMNYNKVVNLADGTNPRDAVTFEQLQNAIIGNQSLAGVLAVGNSAGTNNINMNNNNILNTHIVDTSIINENTTNSGIGFFLGKTLSGIKKIYGISTTVNSTGITVLLTVPLQLNTVYTIMSVIGYYTYISNVQHIGHIIKIDDVNVNASSSNIKEIFSMVDSDLTNVLVSVVVVNNNLELIVNSTLTTPLNITGTVEIWIHN